jgi:hypothetical protein
VQDVSLSGEQEKDDGADEVRAAGKANKTKSTADLQALLAALQGEELAAVASHLSALQSAVKVGLSNCTCHNSIVSNSRSPQVVNFEGMY